MYGYSKQGAEITALHDDGLSIGGCSQWPEPSFGVGVENTDDLAIDGIERPTPGRTTFPELDVSQQGRFSRIDGPDPCFNHPILWFKFDDFEKGTVVGNAE